MNLKTKYLLGRIAQAIVLVFLLSIITFSLSVNSPIDPISVILDESDGANMALGNKQTIEKQERILRRNLGLNLPAFYFNLTSVAHAKQYYTLENSSLALLLNELSWQGYNGNLVLSYFQKLDKEVLGSGLAVKDKGLAKKIDELGVFETLDKHSLLLNYLEGHNWPNGAVRTLRASLNNIKEQQAVWKSYVPTFHFYANNQYHFWLFGNGKDTKGALRLDFGKSYVNGKPVLKKLKRALPWTFVLSLITIVFSLVSSIIIGLVLGYFNNAWWAKGISSFMFLLYTIPSFWLGTILLVFFANPDYFSWFPPGGVKPILGSSYIDGYSWWEHFSQSIPYLILPVVVLSYGNIAALTRYVKTSTVSSLSSLYVFSARARGVREKRIVGKHVFKNVLLPLITIIGAAIPGLFGGSVIVEVIFSIPGMGLALTNAVLQNDVNTVVAIFTISAVLSSIGYLLSDVLYTLVDPRIELEKL